MPPKKQNEKLSLEQFAQISGKGSSGSWADDEAEYSGPTFQTSSQPAAPSGGSGASWTSSGGGMGGMSFGSSASAAVPDQPPYTARIGNVSYDVTESILSDFFGTEHKLNVESLRLPRGPDGQIKGAAYIDFGDRESLVAALKLGGSQILGRTVSVNVAEQRNATSSFGGPRGGNEFDWSSKVNVNEFFGSKPPAGGPSFGAGAGAGAGAGGADGDRFSRFRPRSQQQSEPEIDWSSRGAPLGPPRGGMRAPEPELDWSSRSGPMAPRSARPPRAPEPELDWTSRSGPIAPRSARPPRAPEPELDWSARSGPMAPRSQRPRQQQRPAEPEFDWSQRGSTVGKGGSGFRNNGGSQHGAKSAVSPASSASASAVAPSFPTDKTPAANNNSGKTKKINRLQQGFKALQLDDDEPEEKDTSTPAKATAPEASSISEIQQAQREAASGKWSEA